MVIIVMILQELKITAEALKIITEELKLKEKNTTDMECG